MLSHVRHFVLPLVLATAAASAQADDWPQWRGPGGDHHAAPVATAPVEWSDDEGLAWRTPVPGRGHSSPTVVGDRIYLTTGDAAAGTQSLLIYRREDGRLEREVTVHRGGLPARIHPSNSHASPTVGSDGQRVFALFHNADAVWATAFDLTGNELWRRRAAGHDPQKYQFGFGASPIVVGDRVIVASEYDLGGSSLVGLDAATGEVAWSVRRPADLSFSSPARVPTPGGASQLLLSGNYLLASYDPYTGDRLWSTRATTQATCGTMVWDTRLGMAFASGGYPKNFTLAVRLDGDHEVVWENSVKCYEQSLLAVDGYVYGVADSGVAYCWDGATGKVQWRQRLGGRGYSSSPVLVGGVIYVTSERGETHVFRATPEAYVELAENRLGDSAFATPTPLDGRLYHRYATTEGSRRQEYLAAIGE